MGAGNQGSGKFRQLGIQQVRFSTQPWAVRFGWDQPEEGRVWELALVREQGQGRRPVTRDGEPMGAPQDDPGGVRRREAR